MISILELTVVASVLVPRSPFPVKLYIEPTRNAERGTENVVHDLHLTHTRMVIEGKTIACRIRLFKDDLEKALQLYAAQPGFHLTPEQRADSLFGAYFAKSVLLEADGKRLTLKVSASGTEKDPSSQDVIWYVLEGESPSSIARLGMLNGLMFEMFRDQQNLIQLLREPGGVRKTLYFVSTEPKAQTVSF